FGSAPQIESGAVGRESEDIYAWLRQLDENNAAPAGPISRKDVSATTDVPTWVGRMMGVSAEAADEEEEARSVLPDWLKTAPPAEESPEPAPGLTLDLPPIAAQPPANESIEPETEPPAIPTSAAELVAEAPSSGPVAGPDSLDVDAVFAAMEMPQWSSSPLPEGSTGQAASPPAAHDTESIAPAELPSWVQAMRPVESSVAATQSPESPPLREAAGPLLGLNGVLPSVAGLFVPSSRPKSQAMRLEVSEQQRSQARLLEDLLDAEARPLPLQGPPRPRAPRLIRWLVSGIILGTVGLGLVSASSRFLLPAGAASESNAAIRVVQNLAPDAAVLAVFDYEPATAGEMQVAGAALMDHLLLLKHPRLALISTSPTGSALAEQFISTTLRERSYMRDVQYADLGFLPGGLAGAQLFAQNPTEAVPYAVATGSVWDGPVLKGTARLSDFGAIIVLTDSQEAGAVWIEQTTGRRGAVPLIIVASAQAGPMLLPYYDSGQLQGLVIGINDAAAAEIANGGNPGLVRRYWDAYNIGIYAAVILIVLGAIWQLVAAAVHRRSDRT
ncbi:MAG TPA: hypothetical protein VFH29_08250, partial [Anaerolineales bacterium]|nr:hypothetical protein [Anaerolineales bacterium]